jgi:polysaccharide deacetylase 2 family uncharacterized protein YibQ
MGISRKRRSRAKKRKRYSRNWIVLISGVLSLFLGGLTYRSHQKYFDRIMQNGEHVFFSWYTEGKAYLVRSYQTLVNGGERDPRWVRELDLTIQQSLPRLGLKKPCLSSELDDSSKSPKRLIEFTGMVPWSRIRSFVLSLVQGYGGKVFQIEERRLPGARQLIFLIGRSGANSGSYTLVFQRKAPPARGQEKGPVIALVIDDLGYNLALARSLFSLNVPLTISILPHHRYSRTLAHEAHEKSYEIILHLPMEPHQCLPEYLEKDTLLTGMSKERILEILEANLLDIPWAVGVNNHMGSLMLEDERSMRIILGALKGRGLYFLDSRTTRKSLGYKIAQELDVPTARRNVFLDHKKDIDYIEGQIDLLIQRALKHKSAIGIGHLHSTTIQALKEAIPKFNEEGITLVTLSEVIENSDHPGN